MLPLHLFIFFPAFFFGVCAIVGLSHIISVALPIDIYFSFKSFLFDTDNRYRYLSLVIKLAVPLFSGFITTMLLGLWSRSEQRSNGKLEFYLFVRDNMRVTFFATGAFAALLQAWPTILFWDILADPHIVEFQTVFYFVYILYFISYVIAHPASVGCCRGSVAANTNWRTASTEARLAFAVLTTERKAA